LTRGSFQSASALFQSIKSHATTGRLKADSRQLSVSPEPAISRILFPPKRGRQSFIWSRDHSRDLAVYPKASDGPPFIPFGNAFLFDLAPCGVCPAVPVASDAVRSYRTFSPLPRDAGRCIFCGTFRRVAPPSRYEAHCPVEFGLSSTPKRGRDCLSGSGTTIVGYFATEGNSTPGGQVELAVFQLVNRAHSQYMPNG